MPEVPSFLRRVLTHAGLSMLCFAVVAALALSARHHAQARAPFALRAQLAAAIDDGGEEDLAPSHNNDSVFADDPITDNTDNTSSWSPPSFSSASSWLGYAQGFASSQGSGSPSSPSTPAPRVVNDPSPSDHQASGDASWYSTSPGACAHRTLPTGTVVTVTNTSNGKSTTCTVEGWGPSDTSRSIDLSEEAFTAIANPDLGVVPVHYTW
jgi:hypothetical protein